MLIECPRCAARYDVAEGLIGAAGKSVRCAKCGNVWLARHQAGSDGGEPVQWPETPPRGGRLEGADIPPSPVPAEDEALAEFRAAQENGGGSGFARFPTQPEVPPPRQPRLAGAAALGWAVTLIVLGAAGWGAYAYRDAVMEAWPPSERVYVALGLRS